MSENVKRTDNPDSSQSELGRRKAVQKILAGGGVVGGKTIPAKWVTPLVTMVALPAHAQMYPPPPPPPPPPPVLTPRCTPSTTALALEFPQGKDSIESTFNITNDGTGPMNVTAINVVAVAVGDSTVAVINTVLPQVLNPGGSMTVTLQAAGLSFCAVASTPSTYDVQIVTDPAGLCASVNVSSKNCSDLP